MVERVVPMIHVPDVRATVDWYESIGFTVGQTYGDEGDGLSFAMLSFGSSEVMFNSGGTPSTSHRREVDLYVYSESVDDLYARLKNRVDVVEGPHDTFYGMRELIIRDLNRFWITFGQPSVFNLLMTAVSQSDVESVRSALARNDLKTETLAAAMALVSEDNNHDKSNDEIRDLLKKAGALSPPEIDAQRLQSFVGKYKGEHGLEINVNMKAGKLFAAPGGQQPLRLMALDANTFTPVAFDNYGTITFETKQGTTINCVLRQGDGEIHLERAAENADEG